MASPRPTCHLEHTIDIITLKRTSLAVRSGPLQWELYMARFQYTIEHLARENVMEDITTSWMKGYVGKKNISAKYISEVLDDSYMITSTAEKHFEWLDISLILTVRENGKGRRAYGNLKARELNV